MKRLSWARTYAVFLKEFQEMLRDRLTFAMAIGVPILQLVLFGYAINTDPRGLPTALVSADQSTMRRSIAATVQNTGYFKIVHQGTSEAEGEALLERGDVQFLLDACPRAEFTTEARTVPGFCRFAQTGVRMTEIRRLEPHAPVPESGRFVLVIRRFGEDDPSATLTEVMRATREGIRINTFMLDATPYLQRFIEQLTELNRGRAFFTTPDTLGDYVLVDFLESRRTTTRRGSARRAG